MIYVILKLVTYFAGRTEHRKINPSPSSHRCQSQDILSTLISKPRFPRMTGVLSCAYIEKHICPSKKRQEHAQGNASFSHWKSEIHMAALFPVIPPPQKNKRNTGHNIWNVAGYEFHSCVHSISNKIQEASGSMIHEFITGLF